MSSFSRSKTLLDVMPVDHLPDGLQIIRPDIFVLQVIGVFPHIHTQQWHEYLDQMRFLLSMRDDRDVKYFAFDGERVLVGTCFDD